MAGDWVKMRTWLAKDPKVIAMADCLSADRSFMNWMTDPVRRTCDESVYEHVTRHVTICVTVTGLMQVWGVTRTDGHRDGDDLVIPMTSPESLDEIAGFPGFGEALEFVGWAKYDEETNTTRFPKFFVINASNDELRKQRDAERKRLQRQREAEERRGMSRHESADGHADSPRTVTHREEKRREDIGEVSPITPQRRKRKSADRNYSEDFLRFWELYPEIRKGSKPVAWEAWKQAIKRKPPSDIIDAVERFGCTPMATSPYCPGPAPWLNQDRWDDDPKVWQNGNGHTQRGLIMAEVTDGSDRL